MAGNELAVVETVQIVEEQLDVRSQALSSRDSRQTAAHEMETPVLLIHGENAHSRYYSEEVLVRLRGENKELMIVPGANHTDLYDNLSKIPFDRLEAFFKENL